MQWAGVQSLVRELEPHATTKDPTCHKLKDPAYHNADGRFRVLQLRSGAAKEINIFNKERKSASSSKVGVGGKEVG